MNQDQVKKLLLSVEDAPLDFSVIFSGKKSKKVNGLYKVESREILLHNRNFSSDEENLLIYTAIHEYAHHLHACSKKGTLPQRAHNHEFWAVFHALLEKAEKKGVYRNIFSGSPELAKLTGEIREKYLAENGALVKALGQALIKANELCDALGARFDDYIDRILCIPRNAAKVAIKMFQYNLNPQVGPDNMKFLAGIRDGEKRLAAEHSLLSGKSPDSVREILKKPPDEDPRDQLERERARLTRTIDNLKKRLNEVERELKEL
ncbi:MAG: hypothetical protein LBK40_06930 [Spirochaetaceae bacterium]|jgi:hypothetical protein|nr:hypothetical protein [Spirochaetaceae bacterium]